MTKVRRFSYATRQNFYPTVFSRKIWNSFIAADMYRKRKSEKEWKNKILWNHHTTRPVSSFSRFFYDSFSLLRRLVIWPQSHCIPTCQRYIFYNAFGATLLIKTTYLLEKGLAAVFSRDIQEKIMLLCMDFLIDGQISSFCPDQSEAEG